MEVPPGEDGGAEEDEAEGLIAAESAEIGGAAGFGFGLVELRLGVGRHGSDFEYRRSAIIAARLSGLSGD